ncbi:MAG TPA: hypothetical protein VGK73_12380 [Polyangiaceae bacterium]
MSERRASEPLDAPDPPPERKLGRRSRAALRRIQSRIERYYALETAPDVVEFAAAGAEGEREVLLVKESDAALELALVVPGTAPRAGANDLWLQLLEGVSHFVFVAERARTGLPATQLELELQAEIDKFVLLALEPDGSHRARGFELHRQLFAEPTFLHAPDTELGRRYRLAHDVAARLAARLLEREPSDARALLQRFYRAGQTEKLTLARAA